MAWSIAEAPGQRARLLTPQHFPLGGGVPQLLLTDAAAPDATESTAMNTTSAAVAGAATFLWLGMVLAISFLEAPLKFRAPGVTIPIGLGIGRRVFRALNLVEAALAVIVVAAVATAAPSRTVVTFTAITLAVLGGQLAVVRPRLNRRSDAVLAGEDPARHRSRAHLHYVALELVKVLSLLTLGCAVLAR